MKGITKMKKSVGVYVERFSVDFINKKIIGTKASFDKASKGSGPIYEELARKVANHPDFTLKPEEPKNPPKEKETYKGMDIAWIRSYIEMVDDKKFAEKIEKVIQFAINDHKKPYPLAKKYFLKKFKDDFGVIHFDYEQAKIDVEEYLINKTKLVKKTEAVKNNASTVENKPDPAPAENAA